MVPFIDVMLVLLIIFMVTAPLITPSLIDLPRSARQTRKPEDEAERKKAQQQKLAETKKQQEAEAKQAEAKKAEAAAKQAAADRAATLKRMQGMAGASGSDDSKGTALRSSGPSSGYAGRIAAAVRPNITFPDAETVNGNPAAEFEVSLAPDGTIVGVKLSKSSGLPSWDEAAERGLARPTSCRATPTGASSRR
jgi:colicin import membrane protein